MNKPKQLVSVIIPTFNRPQFLPRAVNSALAGMDSQDIEVIVVPNGRDQSWHESLKPFKNNPSVRVIPIPEANANIARNTGMANARGEFIRFLDDDDYLIPEGAVKQYELIKSTGADVVSGNILFEYKNKNDKASIHLKTDDFCVATLGPWRLCQPTAYVYRLSSISNIKWNPKTKLHQDVEWLINVCASRELIWLKTESLVGNYYQHQNLRISKVKKYGYLCNKTIAPVLTKTYNQLLSEGRLNQQRTTAIAQGLWACVHSSFFLNPIYWTQIANFAKRIDPKSRPKQKFYNLFLIQLINPILILWLLLPKRWIFYLIKYK